MPELPMAEVLVSPWRRHLDRWDNCQLCPLAKTRKRMCFARGVVPADVVFCGEAPGDSEDTLGQPFVGPAGHLLDRIIARALPAGVRVALTNLVCCLPVDETGEKGEPLPEEVAACAPRLLDFLGVANPRLIVAVGTCARDWLDARRHHNVWVAGAGLKRGKRLNAGPFERLPRVDVVHPAYILRSNVANQGMLVQQCVARIATAWEDLRETE